MSLHDLRSLSFNNYHKLTLLLLVLINLLDFLHRLMHDLGTFITTVGDIDLAGFHSSFYTKGEGIT